MKLHADLKPGDLCLVSVRLTVYQPGLPTYTTVDCHTAHPTAYTEYSDQAGTYKRPIMRRLIVSGSSHYAPIGFTLGAWCIFHQWELIAEKNLARGYGASHPTSGKLRYGQVTIVSPHLFSEHGLNDQLPLNCARGATVWVHSQYISEFPTV